MTLGADFLRTELDADVAAGRTSVEIGYRPGEPKRVVVDGAAERSVERLLGRFPVLVFTPDRLRARPGAAGAAALLPRPGAGAAWPRPAEASAEYSRRLSQRNHLLQRVRAGVAAEDGAGRLGHACWPRPARRWWPPGRGSARGCRARSRGGCPSWAGRRAPPPIRYLPERRRSTPPSCGGVLAARRRRDIDRAATGAGPHLDDLALIDAEPRPPPLRLPGRAAAGAAGADPGRGRPARRGAQRAAAAAAGRRHQRARPAAPRAAAGGGRELPADGRHHRGRGRPGRSCADRAAGRRRAGDAVSELRPIADIVRRVGRVPAVDPVVARSREIWADAVGAQVAANSVPVRMSGEAMVVALLEQHVGRRAGDARGAASPRGCPSCSPHPPRPCGSRSAP